MEHSSSEGSREGNERTAVTPSLDVRHRPVMVGEVISALNVRPCGRYIDCTVGEGGHALAVLEAVDPGPRLLGIDLDADALTTARRRLAPYGERVTLARGDFAELERLSRQHGFLPADGILFDLGVSALHLETGERGFSFSRTGPLDMRFDVRQELTAHQVVNGYEERELANIIFRFGEEPKARRVARAIVQARPIETTGELAEIVWQAASGTRRSGIHPATRTFQAIRIAVNQELDRIRDGLEQAIGVIGPGGRLVVISYHSLEDRVAKTILRREESECICPPGTPECICGHHPILRKITRRVVRTSKEEVFANPRGRSARLRVAERL